MPDDAEYDYGAFAPAPRDFDQRPRPGDTRACPGCGRPQHYTGTENGWCHDATFDMLACGASPALLAELEK